MLKPQSSILRKAVVCFLFGVSLASCSPNTVWNVKEDQFAKDLHSGDFDFLKSIDYSKVDLSQITRLGANAPFYMSYILKKIGKPEVALRMMELEWHRGNGVWQKQAARQLITDFLQYQQFAQAEELAKQAFSVYPEREFYRQLLDSWYWQHKDAEVLKGLVRIAEFKNPDGTPIEDRELALFRAVSTYRLGKSGWQQLFLDLFSRQPASRFQIRAFEYFQLKTGMKSEFTATDWAFMEGKYDIAKKEYGSALRSLQPLVETRNPLLLTPWDLRDLGQAYVGASEPSVGIPVFREFVSVLLANGGSSESLYAAYLTLGLLYRSARYYSAAVSAFKSAIGYAANGHQYDRMVWYLLDSERRRSPAEAVTTAAKYSKLWHAPGYFNDVLGELCTDLIQRQEWMRLYQFYRILDGHAGNQIIVRTAYDVASAIDAGYINIPNGKQTARDLLNRVVDLDADRYYTFLASARIGKLPKVFKPDSDSSKVQVKATGEDTDWENYVNGFITYGLYNEAYDSARSKIHQLGDSFLRLLIEQLNRHGDMLESLRLMDRLVARPDVTLSKSELKLYYPQPFNKIIDEVAKKEKLPLPVLYGMVRVESYFNAGVVSSAGAVGLTQLMPATAEDIAHRMGMKDPVITNPRDNLAIGAHYLSTLISQFHDIGEALFAYNAGYTRVFRWKSLYPDLPDDLFLGAVPFSETQGYVKKILVSAVAYGYLYYGMTPTEVVKKILPDF